MAWEVEGVDRDDQEVESVSSGTKEGLMMRQGEVEHQNISVEEHSKSESRVVRC